MKDRERPSLAIRIFAPVFFILATVSAFAWFFYRTFCFFDKVESGVVVFDKGSFYLFGVSFSMLVLAIVTIQEAWVDRPLTKNQSKILTRVAILSVVLIFSVPQCSHYLVNNYLTSNGYSVCDDASHQWLYLRDIVYVKESVECSENAN